MADRYLPASTACSNYFGKASTADPEEGLDVGARIGLDVSTPTHGNADALPSNFQCAMCRQMKHGYSSARLFDGRESSVCDRCAWALDWNRGV